MQLDCPLPPGVIRLATACDISAATALRQRSASTGAPMTWKTSAVTDLSEENLFHREVITPDASIMDEFEEFQSFKRMKEESRKRCREPGVPESPRRSSSSRRSSGSSSNCSSSSSSSCPIAASNLLSECSIFMNCQECDSYINSELNFCANCGTKIN